MAVKSFLHFLHKHFLWIMLSSYLLAAVFPAFGLAIRDVSFGKLSWFDGSTVRLSLPLLMLSLLLFNAGVNLKTNEFMRMLRAPKLLIAGLLANLLVPIVFIFGVSLILRAWDEPPEVQFILLGLAIVASMPIAASSTAWSQKSSGNLSLSLGLVALSTLFSPFTTPVGFKAVGLMASGEYAQSLNRLAEQGTSAFLLISVLLPTILGTTCHLLLGEKRVERAKEFTQSINLVDLLLLNYSNAAIVLPKIVSNPDWDFLWTTLSITISLCALAFFVGWLIPHLFRSGKAEKSSLMFGLGMNNNGTGLVLASTSLAEFPTVMLPIIFYNLTQQVVAGVADFLLSRDKKE